MAVGDDHQMTRAVGIGVENHEAVFAAKDDEVFSVVAAVGGKVAEDTALAVAFGGVEVRIPPWGHECFHVLSSFL